MLGYNFCVTKEDGTEEFCVTFSEALVIAEGYLYRIRELDL